MGKKAYATRRFVVSFSVASCCCLIGAAPSLVDAAPPNPPPYPPITSEQVNEALGLRDSKLAALDIPAPADQLSISVPLGSEPAQLELGAHAVRSADYRVEVHYGDGTFGEVPAGPVRTYRGTVAGHPDSMVAAFYGDDGLHVKVLLADGSRYWVEPLANRLPGAAANLHAVYRNEDVLPSMAKCDAHDGMRLQPQVESSVAASTGACGTGLCIAEIACDSDVEFYNRYGTVSGVEDRINAIINGLNLEYERDVDIRHTISAIIVRVAEPDPYSATNSQTLLNEFRTHWLNNHGNIQRDTAELFTGKDIDSSVIGIAWLGAICGSYGFSVVQADCCGSFACATDLSAHELGHNWNAGHCDCAGTTNWTMNPYITCSNQFHPTYSIPVITSFRDSRTCLSAGSGCTLDSDCDDALFCNGSETCSGGVCMAGSNPCPGQLCDEATDACAPLICNSNGVCDGEEDCDNCASDCPAGNGNVCGNNVCETASGENCLSCPADCNGKQNGAQPGRYCCGQGGVNPVGCSDSRCSTNGNSCTSTPGTPSCCGDGVCEGVETGCQCALDCGAPPPSESNCSDAADEDCDGLTDCSDSDCAAAVECQATFTCGNGVCEAGEDCHSCASDCASRLDGKPSARYCCGDGVTQSVEAANPSLCGGNN